MEPITREEYYLAKIAGTYKGKTPEPVTIDEYYLATMAGDYSGNTPQPVTRLQYYMAKVAGVWGGSIPAPVTRLEYYWAAIASGEGKVFPPVTREEHFLVLVADAYSVVLTVVTGNPALLENSKGNRGLESLTLYGKSTQGSTTGAQLFVMSEVLAETWLSAEKPIDEKAVGYWTSGYIPVKTGNYICSSKGSARGWTYDADKNGLRYIANSGDSPISIKEGEAFIRVTGANTAAPQNFMFNEGNSIKPYEPYTGGKPSPSPEYPQEIESAGQDGEIEVEVLSGNLFDKSAAYDLTQSGGWSASFDGEELKVVGNNITIGSIRLFNYKKTLPAGTYTFSISKPLPFEIRIDNYFLIKKGDTSATVTFDNGVSMSHFAVDAEPGATFNEQRFKIMLNAGSTALPYELYKPAQKLIIPTPNGLPGIPVSSGGNYTDKDGQQWVADEIDLAKGERVKWIGEYELTGKENVADFGLRPHIRIASITIPDAYIDAGNHGSLKAVMSNKYKQTKFSELINNINLIARGQQRNICISIPADIGIEDFKTDLSNQYASGRPVKVFYKLATPIRTPLSPETIAAYKALRTYSPTTTVINDAGAGMSVGYAKMK